VGLIPPWFNEVVHALEVLGVHSSLVVDEQLTLIVIEEHKFALNLMPIRNVLGPDMLTQQQFRYQAHGFLMIHLWEDVWLTRKAQVLGRMMSLLGMNQKIHGRKTQIATVNRQQADAFLLEHHLQGTAKARYKLSLVYEQEVVAVATFSGTRLMRDKAPGYRSSELIRFATKTGYTVIGGLTKLIRHYINLIQPNDLMSYADRDWSQGKAYESLDFTLDSIQDPSYLWVDLETNTRYFPHRLPSAIPAERLVQIFNTGNLKYILYL
jgi:hypothetical protein